MPAAPSQRRHRHEHRRPGRARPGARRPARSHRRRQRQDVGPRLSVRARRAAWVHEAWSGDFVSAQYYLAQGCRDVRARLLVPARRQGPGRERHDGGSQLRQEPRARAPLPELHARQRQRVRELLQLRRLPAAVELPQPRPAGLGRGRPGAPRLDGRPARGLRRGVHAPRALARGGRAWQTIWAEFKAGA